VRRPSGKGFGQVGETDAMFCLEPWLSEPVLLGMMEAAQADAPPVGGLQRGAA